MAFWGVEVRPGQPFTHVSDRVKGRLRVCQATIGIGFVDSATKRILVQCNVGNRSPVLLCSLCPGQTDSCPIGVEFEESEDVIFSIIGPRSVHLVGYYLSRTHSIGIDESESYGEDIANTDTERSNHCSDEDEYEDSFIDDNDPKVSPPSPISYDEELLEDVKPKKSCHRKLQKKYQKVDSDDEELLEDVKPKKSCHRKLRRKYKKVDSDDDHSDVPAFEMEDDDKLPISSVYNGTSERNKVSNGSKQPDKIHEANHNGVSSKSAETPVLDNVPASSKQKKRKRSHVKEASALEADGHVNHDVVSLEITCQDEGKAEKMGKDIATKHTEEWNPANNGNSIVSTKECENSKGKEKKEKKMVKKREEENLKTEGAMEVEVPVPSTMEVQAPLPSTQCENGKEKEKEKKKNKEKKSEDNLKTKGTMEVEVPVPSTMEVQAPLSSTEFENSKEKVKKREEENLKVEGTMEVEVPVPSTTEVQAPLHLTECVNSKEKGKKEKKRVEEKLKTEGTMEMEVPVPSAMEVQAPLPSAEGNSTLIGDTETAKQNPNLKSSQVRTLPNGMIIEELELGKADGKTASQGKKVSVLFIGRLKVDGKIIDSNIDGPFKFRIGRGVIEGLNDGVKGMQAGGRRKVTIPPSLGFGSEGHGDIIPPNSWLVYDIELVKVY